MRNERGRSLLAVTHLMQEEAHEPRHGAVHSIDVTREAVEYPSNRICVEESHWLSQDRFEHLFVEVFGGVDHVDVNGPHKQQCGEHWRTEMGGNVSLLSVLITSLAMSFPRTLCSFLHFIFQLLF